MPAPIIKAVIEFLVEDLGCTVWDGEVPRQDTSQLPINPEAGPTTTPTDWPVVKASMPESGFERTWTTEDAYDDNGEILVQVWGTRRDQAEPLMDLIEASLAQAGNWKLIDTHFIPSVPPTAPPGLNPFYIIHMLVTNWCSVQEEGVRTGLSELLYRCDLHYEVKMHGAIPTL